jgi:hypothetical protein
VNGSVGSLLGSNFNPTLCPLTAENVQFQATLTAAGEAELTWVAERERNVSHYRLERSHDGFSYHYLADQQPLGPNTRYRFTDTEPGLLINETVYYRLRSVDLDGAEQVFPFQLLRREQSGMWLSMANNPVAVGGTATLLGWFATETILHVRIADAHGRSVFHTEIHAPSGFQHIEVPTQALAAGLYTVRAQQGTEWRTLKLLIHS